MSEKGKIIIRKSKKGKWVFEVDINKKQPMKIPDFYDLKDDSLNGKECEVIREKGQIKKIIVDGKELPRKPQKLNKNTSARSNYSNNSNKRAPVHNIYSIQKTKLPLDTRESLGENDIDNYYLKLNKAVNFIFNKEKHREEPILFRPEYKDVDGKFKKFEINFNFNQLDKIIKVLENRQSHIRKELEQQGYEIEKAKLKPDWRLIVGLGNESVYETSMTLHHVYGIPYIPGSAIKGVTRHYFIQNEFEETGCEWKQINVFENVLENFDVKKDEKLKFKDFDKKFSTKKRKTSEDLYKFFYENSNIKYEAKILIEVYQILFGSQKKKGSIVFFDAFPVEVPKIEPDVMNVHYPDYYGDDKPPADYQNPRPIYFLTVKETRFEFMIGIKGKNNATIKNGKFKDKRPLELAFEYMRKALSEYGIGAKTAVGYGYMNP